MIKIANLNKVYYSGKNKTCLALSDVSITFPNKGLYAILGPSGSGKSTLLSLLGGLDYPTSGEIYYDDVNIANLKGRDLNEFRRGHISFIFQETNLIDYLSLKENALLKSHKSEKEIDEVFKLLDIASLANKKPHQLSGGEKERCAIARALLSEAEVLLCDEPTSSLDYQNALKVMELLKKASETKLVVLVSHDKELVSLFTDNIISIRDGKIDNPNKENINESFTKKKEINNKKYKKGIFKRALSHFTHSIKINSLMMFLSMSSFFCITTIIGLANGTSKLLDRLTKDVLNYSPVTVSSYYDGLMNLVLFTESTDYEQGQINVSEGKDAVSAVHKNIITDDFINYITSEKLENTTFLTNTDVSYSIVYEKDGIYNLYDEQLKDDVNDVVDAFLGMDNSIKKINFNEQQFYEKYDLKSGRFPQSDNEAILILQRNDVIQEETATLLNLNQGDEYSKALGKKLYFPYHKDLYIKNNSKEIKGRFIKDLDVLKKENKDIRSINNLLIKYINDYLDGKGDEIDKDIDNIHALFNQEEETRTLNAYAKIQNSSILKSICLDETKSESVEIVGVASVIQNSVLDEMSAGIYISPNLTNKIQLENSKSEIANEIDSHIVLKDGNEIPTLYGYLNTVYDYSSSSVQQFALNLVDFFQNRKLFSTNNEISNLEIHSSSYEERQYYIQKIQEYNKHQDDAYKIEYVDLTNRLVKFLTTELRIAENVLYVISVITFSISIILSFILTFNMISKRKREIAIYRSSGYAKRYIFSLFSLENIAIGLIGGGLGVGLSLILLPLISHIVTNGDKTSFLYQLVGVSPSLSILIITASMLFSFIACLIPTLIYLKRTTVDCLKSNS